MKVTVTLRFESPCLGAVRGRGPDAFPRNADGQVIFMNSWWISLLQFGAQGMGAYFSEIKDVYFDLVVSGVVGTYRRYYKGTEFTEHEAFLAGTCVSVAARIPSQLGTDGLAALLNEAGRFRGLSPYGWRDGWGRFSVVEVRK